MQVVSGITKCLKNYDLRKLENIEKNSALYRVIA